MTHYGVIKDERGSSFQARLRHPLPFDIRSSYFIFY